MAGCALVAAISLTAPLAPGFDAWAWLIWGREMADLELDTTGGPSWKPLPVLLTAPLSLAGGAAPELWLWLIRTAWLLGAALAASLALRLTPESARTALPGGATTVAALAALGVVLIDDSFTPWFRQGATGLSEPLLLALALGAFRARVDGNGRLALGLLFACSLLRPEAWVLFALLAAERWRAGSDRRSIALAAGLVPLLWFGPDLIGSGDPLTGAERAREGSGSPPIEALEAGWRLLTMPLAVLWAGAALAVIEGRRRGDRRPFELALAAALWAGQVAVLAAAGYAGLPRFMVPAAAACCVLGAVGAAIAAERLRLGALPARVAAGIAAAAALLMVGQAAWRGADLVGDVRGASQRAEREADLLRVARSPSVRATQACGPLYIGDYLHASAVAWQAERPLGAVRPLPAGTPIAAGVAIVETAEVSSAGRVLAGGSPLATGAGWRALGFSCDEGGIPTAGAGVR